MADRYEIMACPNSETIIKKIAQKIEQGIGRGVRGEKDYCAIIIIGNELVHFMKNTINNKYFSASTRKQIEIGEQIASMANEEQNIEKPTMDSVKSLILQLLNRDEGWKEYYHNEMDTIETNNEQNFLYERLQQEQEIENFYYNEEYEKACIEMQKFIDNNKFEELELGWYLQTLARYQYEAGSKSNSILTQKSAFKHNKQLLKPSSGIEYKKLNYINANRLEIIKKYLKKYNNYNDLSLSIDKLLENLSFGTDSNKFEEALKDIGELLGCQSQRPDEEIGKGPDNLWCCINNHYLLFECKNEVNIDRQSITKYESGQMNNHIAWFKEQYGNDINVDYFMIIPTNSLSYEGNFLEPVKIINKGKLKTLKDNIKNFVKEFREYNLNDITIETIQEFINLHKLDLTEFANNYSIKFYHEKK